MEQITTLLFVISEGLMAPVIILLLYFFIKSMAMVVEFFFKCRSRQKTATIMAKMIALIDDGEIEEGLKTADNIPDATLSYRVGLISAHRGDSAYGEHELSDYEVDIDGCLSKNRSLIKFGPMLGLMGTLIPMGPALAGLASGDLGMMAYNMQVAFSTTVVGIVVAAIGVALQQADRRYYALRMADLEYIYRKTANQ